MKKVLFTATVDSHILHFHIPYLKWFKEQGYEIHVATNGDDEIPYCDVKHKISFERSPFKINNLKAIKQLRQVINKEKFDLIHCHTPMGSVITRIAAMKARKKYNTKVIYTAHGFHFFKGAPLINWMVFYPVEKILSYKTDCLITINEEDYDLAKKKFHSKTIDIVDGVGVDKSKFDFDMAIEEKNELRKELGLNMNDFVMIVVGELNKNKNQIMAIESMRELVKKDNKVKLLLVGTGNLESFYKEKVNEYQLQNNIIFTGYRKDVHKLLKISDLLLSLSRREGLPVNVIEGLFCKIPIIVVNSRGNRDFKDLTYDIKVIELDDTKQLIESVIKKIENNRPDRKNKEQEVQKYTIDSVMQKVIQIYNNIIN